MPHRVFGLWKKTRKSSWCNLGVRFWSCNTNVVAIDGLLKHCEKGHVWAFLLPSATAALPSRCFHALLNSHMCLHLHSSNGEQNAKWYPQISIRDWTGLCIVCNYSEFEPSPSQSGSCGGLKPNNLNLGVLNTSTQEMNSACCIDIWAPGSFAALLTVARKWKLKCPSTHGNREWVTLWKNIILP